MPSKQLRRWLIFLGLAALFITAISAMGWWEAGLRFLFPDKEKVLYPGVSLLVFVGEHIRLVAISSALTVLIGLPLGVWVTRPGGKRFLPLVTDLTSLGQTFPPVAVLALAVPLVGFGLRPTVLALFLYGLLPVVHNTVAGLLAVPADTLEAAYGVGMGRVQALFRLELPLAAHIILAGIRTSVVINIGTAMIGAWIGAGGLGSPINAGLVQDNIAFIIEGAAPAALLAVIVDRFLTNIEGSPVYWEK